jgi:hypothetical protein
MAVVKNNIVTEGFSGKLGKNLVFRQTMGRTIVATTHAQDEPCSAKQQEQRERFVHATQYAKDQMKNPDLKAAYDEKAKKKGYPSGYNVAVADFFNAPVVEQLDVSAYHGEIGDPIRIEALDDFKVEKVEVEILNQDGSPIESGPAVQQSDSMEWLYQASTANADITGDKVLVKVFDLPGNETDQEQAL